MLFLAIELAILNKNQKDHVIPCFFALTKTVSHFRWLSNISFNVLIGLLFLRRLSLMSGFFFLHKNQFFFVFLFFLFFIFVFVFFVFLFFFFILFFCFCFFVFLFFCFFVFLFFCFFVFFFAGGDEK